MSFLVTLKILGDMALLASAASVVFPWFSQEPGNFFPAMLCCAMGIFCAAALQRRGLVRYAGVIPCVMSLFLGGGKTDLVVIVPMAAYCVFLIRGGEMELTYDSCREFFSAGVKFLGGCFVFASVNMDWLNMLPYGIFYLLTSIFVLRNLRLGRGITWQRMALNLVSLAGTILSGIVLCLVAYTVLALLRYPAGALYFGIVDGFLEIVRDAVYVFGEILTYIVTYFAALMYRNRGNEVDIEGSGQGEPQVKPPENVEPNEMVNTIAGVILILVVAAVLIFFARKTVKMMKSRRDGQGRRTYIQRITVGDRRGEKVTGNRAKVRAVYRKFLRVVVDRGEDIRPDHTSEDILHLASLVADGRDCAALRDVYLSARYDTSHEVTSGQVKEAKNLYNRLKEQ